MDSRIVISFGRNEVLNHFLQSDKTIWTFKWFHNHVFTSSSATLFTMWLVACQHHGTCMTHHFVHSVHSSISHFQTALLDRTWSGWVEDWSYIWHWANRLTQGLLGKDASPWMVPSAATFPNLVHPGRPEPSGGAEHLARVPISTSLQQQNAKCLSHKVQGHWWIITRTVTETRTRSCWCFSGFEFTVTLSSDGVLLPSSHLISSGWKLLHQKSSQPLSLLPRVDAIQLNA